MATMRPHRLLLLVVPILAAAGCGGGGKAELDQSFANRANAICVTQRQQLATIPQPTEFTGAKLTKYLERVVPIARQANADLHDLQPPKGREELWTKLLRAGDKRITQLQRMLFSARSNSVTSFQLASQRLTAADTSFTDSAHDVGLVECAAPGSTS
jgi:hypothetical protein